MTPAAGAVGEAPAGTLSRSEWAFAGLGVVLGLGAMAVDHLLGDDPGLEDAGAFVLTAAVVLVAAALLFGLVVRRAREPRRPGLVVAALAVLSLPLIWLGRAATAAAVVGAAVLLLVTGAYVYSAVEKLA